MDQADEIAAKLWLKIRGSFTGGWQVYPKDQDMLIAAIAGVEQNLLFELRGVKEELAALRAELSEKDRRIKELESGADRRRLLAERYGARSACDALQSQLAAAQAEAKEQWRKLEIAQSYLDCHLAPEEPGCSDCLTCLRGNAKAQFVAGMKAAHSVVLEQRSELGNAWDLPCTAIAASLTARIAELEKERKT